MCECGPLTSNSMQTCHLGTLELSLALPFSTSALPFPLHCMSGYSYDIPADLRLLIKSLYTCIAAYSSGIGSDSFLLCVLGGVKPGCPRSSIVFLLCINPFVFLFGKLSDSPGYSITRVCADGLGSAMRMLWSLRTHASIFKLVARVAGLHLKPCKCVLIITCVRLEETTIQDIKSWLRINVPECSEFTMQTSGKYLGWHSGVQPADLSRSPSRNLSAVSVKW